MDALLFILCAFGSMIQYWRSVAGKGYGLGRANTPLLLGDPALYLIVFLIGFVLKWGSAAVLLWLSGWFPALSALLVGWPVSRIAVHYIFRREFEAAAEIEREIAKRQDG